MRVLAAWILALGLVAPSTVAGAGRTWDDTSPAAKTDTDKDAAAKAKADETPKATSKVETPGKAESASMEAELQQLRDLLETQAKQLQEENEQLKEQQRRMQLLEEQLNTRSASPETAPSGPAASTDSTVSASSTPSANVISKDITNSVEGSGKSGAAQAMNSDEPVALHFRGITLTPGGFAAAEGVWRSKALSADVNTPFNSAPMPGASNSNISELNFSGRQSRISMLMEGKLSDAKIGAYYEGDFLGAGSSSNNNQTNSYVFRQRQFWAQAAFDSGFTVTGGQQWSLVTQTAKGMDNRTEFLPMTIDAQYHIGFSWARQYGLRFTQNFGNKLWLGFSVENPQTTFTVHGNPTTTVTAGATTVDCPVSTSCPTGTTTVGGTSTTYVNFLLGASGASGGLFNPLANYSYNPAPDLVFKAVLEPGWGHYEVFGVFARFRDRVFPCETGVSATAPCPINGSTTPSAAGAFNDSRNGGGVGANALFPLFAKHLDFGIHFLGGNGVGRYGSGGLSDATIRPDGTMALLKNYQALGTLNLHLTPKLDIYMNAGGEYASRAAYTTSAGKAEGYGSPQFSNAGCYTEIGPTTTTPAGTSASQGYIPGSLANCTADTRNLIEGTLGFWYRFYKGSRGTVQYGMQYSYYVRNTWAGTPPASGPGAGDTTPHGVENMAFTSLRYYLP
jgi:transcription elongation GreA/GreB family factor